MKLKSITKTWKSIPLIIKLIFVFCLILVFPYILQIYLHTFRYVERPIDTFSLDGKQALILTKDKELFLLNYQSCKNENKQSNNKRVVLDNLNCVEYIKIAEGEVGKSTAIVGTSTVVWEKTLEKEGLWNIYKSKVNENGVVDTTLLRSFKLFDLGKFAKDYEEKKVSFNYNQLKNQTGKVWTNRFMVGQDEKGEYIKFYDAMVSKVDQVKPVEAVAREVKVYMSGEVSMITKDFGNLIFDEYKKRYIDLKELYRNIPLTWVFFNLDDANNNLYRDNMGEVRNPDEKIVIKMDDSTNVLLDYYSSPNIYIANMQRTFYEGVNCSSYYQISCTKWQEEFIDIYNSKKELQHSIMSGNFVIRDYTYKPRDLLIAQNVSVDEKYLIFWDSRMQALDLSNYKTTLLLDLKYQGSYLVNDLPFFLYFK